ncbi:hypothetical protein MHO82_12970 [Vibrio sp. Of7-15]|uniref:hypothetical protein n=1 Tax=Vibrio sp. Of7-15 TaxID=2724879 RepID=UPI001EF34AD9|nr:hypothetical protein [Vibrio sp. Of7-15]MCG7497776.1 hypothetical protein [Vibrio sp. Of7-15]
MEIVQKKRSNKHTFTFSDESFNFSFKDKSGADDVDLHYADFPNKSSLRIEQNEWLRNVGLLWCVLGVFQLGYAIYLNAPLTGKGFWLAVGLLCVVFAHFSKVKYSVFKAERGNIYIIHDKKHDVIVDELKARKKKQLLDWYGEVNKENDIDNEIGKFNWLHEQGVLTKDEMDMKIAQVEFAHKVKSDQSVEVLN